MAPTIGQKLRQARTERGVELSEVERATKIRAKFLEAMEGDRWEELPAPVYARGFLDIYARYLGLDHEALLEEYRRTVEGEREEQPIPDSVIKPGRLRQNRPTRRLPSIGSIKMGPAAKVLAGVLVLVVVGLVIVGLVGGSDNSGNGKTGDGNDSGTKAAGPPSTTTTTPSTTQAGRVSVELSATAPVWVCLVDDSGTPVVDSETLSADEARGPFRSSRFEVTFGNGSVEMTVDGQAAPVPAVAEPIGYRITPSGVRRLDPSSRPTCV
jgi:cytoskeletal protein RodZ